MEKNKTISQEELEQLMRDAELGDADAQYNLAYCYEYGDGYLFTGAVGTMTITDPGEDGFNLLKTLVSSAKKNSSFSGGDNEEALLEDNINKSLENIVQ
mgnify:CR=1 FL=1